MSVLPEDRGDIGDRAGRGIAIAFLGCIILFLIAYAVVLIVAPFMATCDYVRVLAAIEVILTVAFIAMVPFIYRRSGLSDEGWMFVLMMLAVISVGGSIWSVTYWKFC